MLTQFAFVQLPQSSFILPLSQAVRHVCAARRPRSFLIASPPCRRVPPIASQKSGASFDYYKTLGVQEDADATAIKRAYRRAALKNHPDVSDAPDARDRFLRVQEAYNILSDNSKRAEYDRSRRAAAAGSPFDGTSFGDFDVSGAAEFARRWREKNPMPEDINDSFGSIFSDLFSGVADAFGSGASAGSGVVEDFIEFLEKRVDGFSSRSSTNDYVDDALQSSDEDVLRAEIDDARFVIDQLKQRRRKAQNEEDELRKRAREWSSRAERAEKQKDYHTRVAAKERNEELLKEAKRFSRRVDESNTLIRQQQDRLKKLEARLDQVRKDRQSPKYVRNSNIYDSTSSETSRLKKGSSTSQEAIDDELEKMKRELGLS